VYIDTGRPVPNIPSLILKFSIFFMMTLNKDDSFLLQICPSKFVIRKLAITKHVCTKWSHFTFIFCSVQMKMQIIYDFFNTKKNLPNIIQQYFFGILLFRIISIPSKTFYFDGMLGTGLPVFYRKCKKFFKLSNVKAALLDWSFRCVH
jgi:hypothetical protein